MHASVRWRRRRGRTGDLGGGEIKTGDPLLVDVKEARK
jgi:hypothetical protein